MSNVDNDTPKAAFREVCDVTLEKSLDLEQVYIQYKDQYPNLFIEKGVKLGIARRFVENIVKWVQNVKKAYLFLKLRNLCTSSLGRDSAIWRCDWIMQIKWHMMPL